MFLSVGFRPFFLLGAIWAAVAMILWIAMLAGFIWLPISIDAVSWHAHEFLFGYLGAIIAGFLLTAIPSWTGRAPIGGPRLVALVLIWLAGRIVFSLSDLMSPPVVALIDLLFPLLLAAVLAYEIAAARNWKNLVVIVALAAFVAANGMFHLETGRGDPGAQGYGLRFGLAAALMQISIIGGRVIPVFTRNWMVKADKTTLPSLPMQPFDVFTLGVTALALIGWVIGPDHVLSAYVLIAAGLLQVLRLARWSGAATTSDTLLFILHVGYAFVPIGAILLGLSILFADGISAAAAQHVWMAGAIGTMTLALMTRASLGHSGQQLRAGAGTNVIYDSVIGATIFRLFVDLIPLDPMVTYSISAALWILAFLGFVLLYGRMLLGKHTAGGH